MIADTQLLDRWLKDNDAEAFREIVKRHADVVYAASRRVLGESSLAEDVSQDCFMKLSSRKAGEIKNLPAWLHRVATRNAISLVRSEQRRRQYAEPTESNATDPSELASWRETEALVDRAIDNLPVKLRTVVIGHFLEGHSHAALCERLNIPKRTVSDRIQRGIEAVRRQLKQNGCGAWALSFGDWSTGDTPARGWQNGVSVASAPQSLVSTLGKIAIAGGAVAPTGLALVATGSGLSPKLILAAALALIVCSVPLVWEGSPETEVPSHELRATRIETTIEGASIAPQGPARATVQQASANANPGQFLSGRVVARGVPVPGVAVSFLCFPPDYSLMRRSPNQYQPSRLITTHSDQHGEYRFATELVGKGILSAFHDRYKGATMQVEIEAGGRTLAPDLELKAGRMLRGVVLATNGMPIKSAIVRLEHAHDGRDYTRGWGFTKTDAIGEFTLGIDAKASHCALSVHTGDLGLSFYHEVKVTNIVRLTFAERASIRGKVTLQDGTPARAQVRARAIMPEPKMSTMYSGMTPSLTFEASVDETGQYEINDLDPELDFSISVVDRTDQRQLTPAKLPRVELEPGEISVWNYSVEGMIVVHGTLLTQNSAQAIVDRRVMVSHQGKTLWTESRSTDAKGQFKLKLKSGAGMYRFFSEFDDPKSGESPYAIERQLRADETLTIKLLAPEPTTLPIQVSDSMGSPVRSVQLRLQLTRIGVPNMTIGRPLRLDENGRTRLMVFREASSASVTVSAFPRGPQLSTGPLALRRGASLPEQQFVLPDASHIRGRLIDAEGQPLSNLSFRLLAHYPDGTSDRRGGNTDAAGAFDMRDICRVGPLEVEIWAIEKQWRSDGFVATAKRHVELGTVPMR